MKKIIFFQGSNTLDLFNDVVNILFNRISPSDSLLKPYHLSVADVTTLKLRLGYSHKITNDDDLIMVGRVVNVTLQLLAIKLIDDLFDDKQKKNRESLNYFLSQKQGAVTYGCLKDLILEKKLIEEEIRQTKLDYHNVVLAANLFDCLMFDEEPNRYNYYYVIDMFTENSSFEDFLKQIDLK